MAKGKILIVEDSILVSMHLSKTLESEGYVVCGTANSGEIAVEVLDRLSVDLVLMDIMLSGRMDGIETATVIKQRFNIPVVYITALTDRDTIQRAKITEPYGYLTKPFEDREIFTVIEMALYKHGIERKLKHSEERYFSTVNSISDAVIVTDKNFQVTYINPTAEKITGYTHHEAFSQSIFDVLVLKDEVTEELLNPLLCPLVSGKLSTMPDQILVINKRGKKIPIGESSLSPLINNHNDFSGLVIIFKNLTEKKQYKQLLLDLEKQKMAALIEGQEKERSRIAKDLHDGLGQMLNAIKMNANAIVKDASSALDLYKLIDEAIQESKRISENLLPSKLQDFDLPTCLKSLCSQMANSAPATKISFDYIGDNASIRALQKINLYRITQEALTNATKHAQASTVDVQLIEEDDQIRLTIEDDGNGISFQNQLEFYKQNGLVNMRDRAETMGGKFVIESDANRGTLLIIEVPIKQYTDVKI